MFCNALRPGRQDNADHHTRKDMVCNAGVVGASDMYIVSIGKMGVIHPKTGEIVEGTQVYGTQALFGLSKYPSSVEALDFSDIFSLSAVVFKECLNNAGMNINQFEVCLLYTSPSPRDKRQSRMPSSA